MCQNNCGRGLISNTNLGANLVFYKTKSKRTIIENREEKIINKNKDKRKGKGWSTPLVQLAQVANRPTWPSRPLPLPRLTSSHLTEPSPTPHSPPRLSLVPLPPFWIWIGGVGLVGQGRGGVGRQAARPHGQLGQGPVRGGSCFSFFFLVLVLFPFLFYFSYTLFLV